MSILTGHASVQAPQSDEAPLRCFQSCNPRKCGVMTLPIGPWYVVAIGVAADVFENGANIETGAATNAVQGVALLGVGEQAGAMDLSSRTT